jgi:hypothetical protein
MGIIVNENNSPTIGLGIMHFNDLDGLEATISNLENQTEEFDEIYIFDDASKFLDVVRINNRIMRSNLKIKLHINQKNKGTFLNVKNAFEILNTKYVTTMGAGDYLDHNFVKIVRSNLKNVNCNKTVLIPYKAETINNNNFVKIEKPRFSVFKKIDFLILHFVNLSYDGGAIFHRKSVLETKLFTWEEHLLMEDWYIWYYLFREKFNIKILRKALYIHTVDGDNIQSREKDARNINGSNLILNKILETTNSKFGYILAQCKKSEKSNKQLLSLNQIARNGFLVIIMKTLLIIQLSTIRSQEALRFLFQPIRSKQNRILDVV